MTKIETKLETIDKKLDEMPTKAEMDLANEKLVNYIFKNADNRYASKLVERVVYGVIGVIATTAIGALVYLFFK